MKTLRNSLLMLTISIISCSMALAQAPADGSEVIGRWNLTIMLPEKGADETELFRHGLMNTKGFPGWLEVSKSGFSTLVGYYVGYEGSARPVSEVTTMPRRRSITLPFRPSGWM